jgi:hypothetical protein
VPSRRSAPSIAGPGRAEEGRFELAEWFCPSCATVLEVETLHGTDMPLEDDIAHWPT